MRTRAKLAFAALTAALLLSLAIGTAAARSGISPTPVASRAVFAELTFAPTFDTIECAVELHFTFHTTITKSVGTLAGQLNALVGACEGGRAGIEVAGGVRVTGLQGPYHVKYSSFTGTLPGITSVTLDVTGLNIWIETGLYSCTGNSAIRFTTTGGNPVDGVSINMPELNYAGGAFCNSATLTGNAPLTVAIRLSLT